MRVIVFRKHLTAPDICALTLASADANALPPFSAGSHIELQLPNGLTRAYSLCNSPLDRETYQLGVLLEPESRGGSRAVHELVEGVALEISEPRNHFPLQADQKRAVLLAGGIGVTPLLSMAEQLLHDGLPFELHYCSRSDERIAFVDRLSQADMARHVRFHIDTAPETRFDAASDLPTPDADTHLYVCGPRGFIDRALGSATSLGWQSRQLHREYFAGVATRPANTTFRIRLASSGMLVEVSADQSAAQALKARGVAISTSCEQGVCGKCITRVISGMPDHRDLYLTDEEHAGNALFAPCCSRALSDELLIDL